MAEIIQSYSIMNQELKDHTMYAVYNIANINVDIKPSHPALHHITLHNKNGNQNLTQYYVSNIIKEMHILPKLVLAWGFLQTLQKSHHQHTDTRVDNKCKECPL